MSTILELNNIKKAYDVKMAVDIDKLVIEDGDCVGLVGESGCGKSTLAVDNATTIAVALLKYTGARKAVPIYMDKSCVTLAAFMGVVMTGNFYVLLEPAHPAERIHSILDTLQADIIVTNRKNEKKAAKLGSEIKVPEGMTLMRTRLQSSSLQAILYTLKTCLKHRLQMRTERSFRILRQMLLI